MAIINIPTVQQMYNTSLPELNNKLDDLGIDETQTNTSPSSAILESQLSVLYQRLIEVSNAVEALNPSPTSPLLPGMLSLIGITYDNSLTPQQNWDKRLEVLNEPSLGSRDALYKLVTGQTGISDVLFVEQTDGDFNTYILSSEPPESGAYGIPTSEQNTAIGTLLNDGSRAHLGVEFDMITPTATQYSVLLDIYYNFGEYPNTPEYRAAIDTELMKFANNRKLKSDVNSYQLYKELCNIDGLTNVSIQLFTTNPNTGTGSLTLPISSLTGESPFYTTKPVVNTITAQTDAVQNEINVIYHNSGS